MSSYSAKEIAAEVVFIVLLGAIVGALWYDYYVPYENTVSVVFMTAIYTYPVLAFAFGALVMLIVWVLHKLWDIKYRHVILVTALGVCVGHLVWAQHPPRKSLPVAPMPHLATSTSSSASK